MKPGSYLCPKKIYTLKFLDIIESNIAIKGITIVKSTANKSSCNSFGDNKRHILVNATNVTNMIKPATTSLGKMLSRIVIINKDDSLIPC